MSTLSDYLMCVIRPMYCIPVTVQTEDFINPFLLLSQFTNADLQYTILFTNNL